MLDPSAASSLIPKASTKRACAYIEQLIKALLEEQNTLILVGLDSLLATAFSEMATHLFKTNPLTEVSGAIIGFFFSNLLHGTINYHILSDRWLRFSHMLLTQTQKITPCCKRNAVNIKRNETKIQIFKRLLEMDKMVRKIKKPSIIRPHPCILKDPLENMAQLTLIFNQIPAREARFSDFIFESPFTYERKIVALSTTLGMLLFDELFDPEFKGMAAGISVLFGTVFTWTFNLLYYGFYALIHCGDLHAAKDYINIQLGWKEGEFKTKIAEFPKKMQQALPAIGVWQFNMTTPPVD